VSSKISGDMAQLYGDNRNLTKRAIVKVSEIPSELRILTGLKTEEEGVVVAHQAIIDEHSLPELPDSIILPLARAKLPKEPKVLLIRFPGFGSLKIGGSLFLVESVATPTTSVRNSCNIF
jgi:hypothetical protein